VARIFLSHSHHNDDTALILCDWLVKNGWDDVFVDFDPHQGLAPGEFWQEALRSAADRCQVVLCLISPEWQASHWCKAEFLLAKQLGKRIFPILIGSISIDELPIELKANYQIVDLTRDPYAWERLKEGLKRAGLDPETFSFPAGRRPYPGFEPLTEEDAAIFFGREAQIVRCLDRLRAMSEAGVERLLVILGASGAGKSSFVRAGLWPRLNRDDRNFLPLPVIRPERGAMTGKFGLLAALERSITASSVARHPALQSFPRSRAGLGELLTSKANALSDILIALQEASSPVPIGQEKPMSPAIVISIDQAEELFNEDGKAEADQFLDQLVNALTQNRRLLVIIAIRSDAFPRLQIETKLEAVRKEPFDLPPLAAGSLRLVIEGPARVVKPPLKLDPRLVEALLEDAAGQETLPLLAFALGRLYREYGAEGELTFSQYEHLGRIRGAVNAAVIEVLDNGGRSGTLPHEKTSLEALLRELFIPHLARVNETGQFARRVAAVTEIPIEARTLIDLFVDARLLIRDRRAVAGKEAEVVEVAHEALLREWPTLRAWLDADREFLVGKEQLAQEIAQWEAAPTKDKPDALLSGLNLTRARQWLHERHVHDLSESECKFIKLSIKQADTRQRRKRQLAAAAVVVLLLFSVVAVWKWVDAVEQRDIAQQRLLLARNTSETLVSFVAQDLQKVQGIRTDTVRRVLDAARSLSDLLAPDLREDATFQESRANMMSQFGVAYLTAGDLSKATASFQEALQIYQQLAAKEPSVTNWQKGIADQIDQIGGALQKQRSLTDAQEQYERSLMIRQKIAELEPGNFLSYRGVALSYYNLGEVQLPQGNAAEALNSQKAALDNMKRAIDSAPNNNDLQSKLSLIYVSLGTVYQALQREDERLKSNLAAVAIRENLTKVDPDNSEWKRLLSWAYTFAGNSYEDQNNLPEALKKYQDALSLRKEVADLDFSNRTAQYDLAWGHNYVANILKAEGDLDGADAHYQAAFNIRVTLTRADPENLRWAKDLALSVVSIGELAEARHNSDEALTQYEDAATRFEALTTKDPSNADWLLHLSRVYNKIAKIYKDRDNLADALDWYQRALAVRRKLLVTRPDNLAALANVAISDFLVGDVLRRQNDNRAAREHFNESVALNKHILELDPNNSDARSEITKIQLSIAALDKLEAVPIDAPAER
jgi:tetratricopeptide (TPR) repeat protein